MIPTPEEVSEEAVTKLLVASDGRMPSTLLIARFEPLDAVSRRTLASIVQRLCRTVLPPEGSVGVGATIVLRRTLAAEMAEARAAKLLQKQMRWRWANLEQAAAAATCVQAAARRRLAHTRPRRSRPRDILPLPLMQDAPLALQAPGADDSR